MRPFLAFLTALTLVASPLAARAQPSDGVRFRGGVGLEGGALVPLPAGQANNFDVATLGTVALEAQLGVQITRTWAAYAAPSFGVVFSGGGAVPAAGTALLAEYTFEDVPIALGAGVETSPSTCSMAAGCTSPGTPSSPTTGKARAARRCSSDWTRASSGSPSSRRPRSR